MAQVDGLGYMLEILRRRIATDSKRTDGPARSRSSTYEDSKSYTGTKIGIDELRNKIRERIRALNPDDSQHQKKATQIFFESVLLWEFGDDIALSREFAEIVANINSGLTSHPKLQRDLGRLIGELMRQ